MEHQKNSWFGKFAKKTSCYAGRPVTFGVAILLIVVWAASGPLLKFSDTWQLIVNTSTTIVTFLMVFLIQNSQNRPGWGGPANQTGRVDPDSEEGQQRPHGSGRPFRRRIG